jgi:hypothetical protein
MKICMSPIPPGASQGYVFNKALPEVDGVLYSDGTMQGSNTWGIDKHYRLWNEVQAGGPVFPSSADFGVSGDSIFFAQTWVKQFARRHGFTPMIVVPLDCNEDCGMGGPIVPGSAYVQTIAQPGNGTCFIEGPGGYCVGYGDVNNDTVYVDAKASGYCQDGGANIWGITQVYSSCQGYTVGADADYMSAYNGGQGALATGGYVDTVTKQQVVSESTMVNCTTGSNSPPEVIQCGGGGH